MHAGHQRAEAGAEFGAGGGQRARGHGAAVEAAVEHDDVRAAGGLTAEPQRGLDRLAAGVGEEHPVQARRKHFAQPLDQGEQRAVHDGRVLAMDQRADLALRGFDHPRVAVPGAGHADPRGEVEVSAVVLVVEQDAFTTGGETPVACLRICESLRATFLLLTVDG